MEHSPSWQAQAVKEFPAANGARKFITAFTRACQKVLWLVRNIVKFLRWAVVSTLPKSQAEGPPLVGCPRLLIQYIRSYPPYLQAVPPSATWGRAMPWWQGPTYHCDRDPLITDSLYKTSGMFVVLRGPKIGNRTSFLVLTGTPLQNYASQFVKRYRSAENAKGLFRTIFCKFST
jgi:hypothetical protein